MKPEKKPSIADLLTITKPINQDIKPNQPNRSFDIVKLSVYDLEPHPKNKYSMEDILDLKDSIELLGGIEQNLIVKKNEGASQYTVIAGHRRRLASLALVEEGKKQFELVPCRIKSNLDSIIERILLIHTNSTTRILSDWEKTEQLKDLKELFTEYKKEHNLPGRIQELLAETLNISQSQVARFDRIDRNLTEDFKEEFKKGDINFSTAAELATLSLTDQKAVYEQHKEKGETKLKDVKKVKEKLDSKPEQIPGTQHLTVNAANRIKKNLEHRLSLAETDRKGEIAAITENTEYIRLLNLLIETVNKAVFEVMGGNIFTDK